MESQKIVSQNDRTALVYAGILRKLNSGLKIAYIGEDGDEPDWPTALEDFDAHLRSVSVNKTELADALLQKGVFPAACRAERLGNSYHIQYSSSRYQSSLHFKKSR